MAGLVKAVHFMPHILWLCMLIWLLGLGIFITAKAISGEVLGNRFQIWYRRKENPMGFWTVLVIQIALWLILIGFTIIIMPRR
jgi:hypothetical protein